EKIYEMQSGLVHRVCIYPWKSGYTYYEKFCRDGEYLRRIKGKEAPHVGFFSYMPQYGQMTKAQLAYYLWWRENIIEHGIYLPADYSYILLNIYELINLPDDNPLKVRDALCRLWVAYKKDTPRLDRYFAEWICDYCLLHGLPAPVEQLAPIWDDVLAAATLKEFYLDAGDGRTASYVRALLAYCCQYDYRKSKFATGESKALYDQIIPGVLMHLLEANGEGAKLLRGKGGVQDTVVSRDSYVAALCSHRIKKRIEVQYCSVSRSHELRMAVTDMVKYTENRIRAHMGVKSRLGVGTLSEAVKREMDAYLDGVVPRMKNPEREQVEQYEKLYDLPATELDLSRSAEIEQASWETTKKLIEAFDPVGANHDSPETITPVGANHDSPETIVPVGANHDSPETIVPVGANHDSPASAVPDGNDALNDALADYLPFIRAAANGDASAQMAFCRTQGKMLDAVADEINGIAADVFGDVILEEDGSAYAIIEDYKEELAYLWR
ncbi:MAG: TerB N-terminal domain-containing protein, partial [Clostridia bacterium]|nr:TerB N-terminal domain-containing protein [Clostridia bacterium]